MKISQLIVLILVAFSCKQRSKIELLNGEWKIVSCITKNKYTDFKLKEMVDAKEFSIVVKFEKDSLRIIEKDKIEAYDYYLSGDSIIIPRDALGGKYLIKKMDDTRMHLYQYKKFNMQDGEVLVSTSSITLLKK